MRILHAANNAEVASVGVEQEVTNLALAQQARGADVTIVIDREGTFIKRSWEHPVPVIEHLGLGRSFGRPDAMTPEEKTVYENTVLGFAGLLKRLQPDVIHCHSARAAVVGMTAGNRLGIPCALTGDSPAGVAEGWRRGLRFATLCLNTGSFDLLKGLGVPDIHYVPNGTKVMPPGPARHTDTGHSSSLISVGSLVPRKRIDVVILAMVELRRRLGQGCPPLRIYGDGPQRSFLVEMTAVLELNEIVRFCGFKPGVLETCPSTDILVMASREDPGSLVVREAMSRGMPIVATDVGDVAEMLPDKRYGRVIPLESVLALADGIESLLADIGCGRFDPGLLIERHRAHYSTEKWVERVDAVYSGALARNGARSARR